MDVSATATIVVTWVSAALSLSLIAARFSLRRYTPRKYRRTDDVWIGASVAPLLARAALVHAVMVLGTNDVPHPESLDAQQVAARVLGSKFIFVARVLFPTVLWCSKCSLLVFYGRLVEDKTGYGRMLNAMWFVVTGSFAAIVLVLLLQCLPVQRAWQVVPSPGPACTEFIPFLLVQNSLNIVTDVLIMLFPLPLIFASVLPLKCKIQVSSLFSLGLLCVVMTAIRTPLNLHSHSFQSSRTLWSSVEVATTCIVANAPALHGIVREWQRRRTSALIFDGTGAGPSLEIRIRGYERGQGEDRDEEAAACGVGIIVQKRTKVVQKVELLRPGTDGDTQLRVGPVVEIIANAPSSPYPPSCPSSVQGTL